MTLLTPGSWPTPITSELVVRAAARLGEVCVDGNDVYWSEARPTEGGRSVIVRRSSGGTLWFTEFSDQRLYRLVPGSDVPVAVTPAPEVASGVRHADLRVVAGGTAVLAVRE